MMHELEALRLRIQEIDSAIVRLLVERVDVVLKIGLIKK